MTTETPPPNPAQRAPVPSRTDALLSELAGDPDMSDLIRSFVDEIPERVRLVQSYWESQQLVELRRIAHQLKGACGGYGFPQLGQAAGQLENDLNDQNARNIEAIASHVAELVSMCRRVRAS